jgi:hypothetical protein
MLLIRMVLEILGLGKIFLLENFILINLPYIAGLKY